jgi:hypothetical protein
MSSCRVAITTARTGSSAGLSALQILQCFTSFISPVFKIWPANRTLFYFYSAALNLNTEIGTQRYENRQVFIVSALIQNVIELYVVLLTVY